MEKFYFILLIVGAILLQGSIFAFPLVLMVLTLLYCSYRTEWIFLVAFASGILLDIFLVRPVGITSSFFLIFLFLIFLYQKKFEVTSPYFVFLSLFLGSFAYYIFFRNGSFISSVVCSMGGAFLFFLLQKIRKTEGKKTVFSI